MVEVNTPKRLFWMIVLALFIPWLSVALTAGWTSRKLGFTLLLTPVIPFALGAFEAWRQYPTEDLQLSPVIIILSNLATLASVCYAIHSLIKLHYNPEYLPAYEESQSEDNAINIGETPAPRDAKV